LINKAARCAGSMCLSLLLIFTGCGSGGKQSTSESGPIPSPSPSAALTPSSVPTNAVSDPSKPASTPAPSPSSEDDEISNLISAMTLEQKIGQMILAGVDGTSIDAAAKKMILEQHVGGIIMYKNNFSDLSGSARFVNALKKANKDNPIPLFISVDQEGGKVSRLPKDFVSIPDAATVGRSDNAALAKKMGSLLSQELQLMGFNVDFAPVLDINSNPKNPVIGNRAFGNNAKLVSKMGISVMNGLREGGTVAVVKHFPGHGDTAVDSHLDLPVVNKTTKQLESMEWVPFRAAIDEQADAVMVAHILFPLIDPDAPASLSKIIIGEQLRGTLGYDGVVITDDMTMGAIAHNYGIADAAVMSVEAGSDIVLVAHGYDTEKMVFDKLLQAVRSGKVDEIRIDQSVRRILTLKLKYKLSDQPIPIPTIKDLPNNAIRQWVDKLKKG